MALMLDHVDSPHIRCIGFLYLRYAADPATLWSWFEPYLHDGESVQVCQGKADTTVGRFVQMLLNDLDYYGTRLPRPPLVVERQFKVKLLLAEKVEERAKRHMQNHAAMEYFQKTGARIQALYGDDDNPVTWYDAVVDRVILRDHKSGDMLARPKFQVTFPEYGNTELVTLGEVDLPGSSDVNRPEVHRCGSSVRDDGRNETEYSRGHDSYKPNERIASSSGRGYSDDRGRGFDNRRRDVGGYGPRGGERSRDRSRSRDRDDSNLNDARREDRELMDEVLRRERDKIAAKGRAYAARPLTFQDSLVSPGAPGRHISDKDPEWKSHGNQEGRPKVDRRDVKDGKPATAPIPQKTTAELASIEEKKRMLMARYG
jgi:pre-mRNA-splicing factor 38B